MTDNKLGFKNIAISAARLADAKKAEDVTVYDMAGRSELADYVVVVTVDNPAQLDAVDDEIVINLKKEGLYALYRDGMKSKNWKILDYGGIIIHIFEKQAREFFSFDKVYAGYSAIKWAEKEAVTSRRSQGTSRKAAPQKAKTSLKKARPAPKKAKKTVKKVPAKKGAERKAQVTGRKTGPKKKTAKKKK